MICYDSRSLISSKNRSAGELVQAANDECELYFFSTLFANYIRITNYASRIANTRIF